MHFPPIKNLEQITRDPTLRAIKPWWVVSVGAVILYLVPAKFVLEMSVVGLAVNGLASLIPSIARWVELSPFPHHTKLFAVFVWVMVPVQIYWLITSIEIKHSYQVGYMTKSAQQTIMVRVAAFVSFLALLLAIVFLAFNLALVDTPPCRICVNTSKWAQLFIGCLTSILVSMMIVFIVHIFPLFLKSLGKKSTYV